MSIVLPEVDQTNDVFRSLLNKPNDLRRAMKGVHDAVEASFRNDAAQYGDAFAARVRTGHEQRRRIQLCMDWFKTMRMEYGYGLIKTIDELPKALEITLSGGTYIPVVTNSLWVPKEIKQ